MFAWPFEQYWMCVFVFVPALTWLMWYICTPWPKPQHHVLTAVILIVIAQNLVFAVFRGVAWSRYTDNLSLGIIVNLACILFWSVNGYKRWIKISFAALWLALSIHALFKQDRFIVTQILPGDLKPAYADLQIVRQIARGIYPAANISVTGLESSGVREVVTDPTISQILPTTIREGVKLRFKASTGLESYFVTTEEWNTSPWPGFSAFRTPNTHRPEGIPSELVNTKAAYLTFLVHSHNRTPSEYLVLETQSGENIIPKYIYPTRSQNWHREIFQVPSEPFRVVAHTNGVSSYLFSEPVETPTLSLLAERIATQSLLLLLLGSSFLMIAVLLVVSEVLTSKNMVWAQYSRDDGARIL